MSIFNKGVISKALAATGSFLLTLSGQAQAAANPPQAGAKGLDLDDRVRSQAGNAPTVAGPDGRRVTVDEVRQGGEVRMAAHVNSGPPTHTNVPGHADFTSKMQPGQMQSQPAQIGVGELQKKPEMMRPGGGAAAHVNSGPTTHTNVPGHADFTSKMQPGQMQTQPGAAQLPAVQRPGSGAAAHVNSGPTSHTNVPGHADFTGKMQPGEIQMQQPIKR